MDKKHINLKRTMWCRIETIYCEVYNVQLYMMITNEITKNYSLNLFKRFGTSVPLLRYGGIKQ